MIFLNSHEKFERNTEEIKRSYGNDANRNIRNSTRRTQVQKEQEIQAGMYNFSGSPNKTRLPIPKTRIADPQLAEIANMISELADKPASIPQDDTKETDFLAKLAMASRDTRNEISNLRAQTALIQ